LDQALSSFKASGSFSHCRYRVDLFSSTVSFQAGLGIDRAIVGGDHVTTPQIELLNNENLEVNSGTFAPGGPAAAAQVTVHSVFCGISWPDISSYFGFAPKTPPNLCKTECLSKEYHGEIG
jgi:hypothetical protein